MSEFKISTMPNKKVRGIDNSDSNDSSEKHEGTGIDCPHIAKAVDINCIKKTWKKKDDGARPLSKKKTPLASKKVPQIEQDLWICMKCGHTGSANNLEHYQTPRSDLHAVVAVVENWTARCIQCRGEINLESHVKVLNAIEFLKKNFLGGAKEAKAECEEAPATTIKEKRQPRSPPMVPLVNIRAGMASIVSHYLPVLGLENIGNTCYINAILQCLAQTPDFVPEQDDSAQNGETFHLPGGDIISKEHGEYAPPLVGKLGEMGPLNKAVIKLLSRVRNGEQLRRAGVNNENPGEVLRLMKKVSNTFYIGEQHDSHELLRLLLECLKSEDLKRYQKGILNTLKICTPNKEVSARDRELLIAYKKQAMQSELAVDNIFSGSLVSVLKCMECGFITTNIENFMDISLPVESEKPKPFERPVISENKMSKHQLKRERKLARKGKKKNKGAKTVPESIPQAETPKIRSSSDSASADSEADIEDNLDSETPGNSALEDTAKSEAYSEITESDQKLSESELSRVESTGNSNEYSGSVYFYTEQSASSPESGVVQGCSPEPGTVLYGCSPEPTTVTYGCSAEPSNVEDFGSCEGGRGSPASSIEQSDWDEERNGKTDYAVMGKSVKELQISGESYPLPEAFELSEEDSLKDSKWGDVSREEFNLTDSAFELFSPRGETNPSLMTLISLNVEDIKSAKVDEPFNYLDIEKHVKAQDRLNVLDYAKQEVGDDLDCDDLNKNLTSSLSAAEVNNGETDDNIWDTTLAPLPDIGGPYSIYNCLNQFFSKELLSDSNRICCIQCTKCKIAEESNLNIELVLANAWKQLLFIKLPKVLTLHLKRFEVLMTRMCKITRKVSFPLILDIAPYTSVQTLNAGPDNLAKYELYGVIEHTGHLSSGHYVAYVQVQCSIEEQGDLTMFIDDHGQVVSRGTPRTNNLNSGQSIDDPMKRWYLISDTHVREVNFKEVASAEAYLLFYRKL